MTVRSIRNIAQEERGTTLVEFAMVVPVLILVLVATLDFARALNAYVTIANASRDGARYAIVHPDAENAAIRDHVVARIVPLDPRALTVKVRYDRNDRSGFQPWPSARPGVPPGVRPSSPAPREISVTVEASYDWRAVTWMVGSLFSLSGNRVFGSTSTMVTIR
jgi:Flp pilus assembly protein TadG